MSLAIFIPAIVLGAAYATLMMVYLVGWLLEKSTNVAEHFVPRTKISVVIAARNEAENIGRCIDSILAQDYPAALFEVIVVDDFSEDDTAGIVAAYNAAQVRLVKLSEVLKDRSTKAFKKAALSAGIARSSGELIVTTDADCSAGPRWLLQLAAKFEQDDAQVIIAPVTYIQDHSVAGLFQSLDFMTMQGITAAARRLGLGRMANGANFAFSREAYDAVNGYEDTTHIASGDDYLLLVKLANRYPQRIRYLKSREAIVRTAPQAGWKALLNQRIRWASKSGKYKDQRLTAILILVYLFNLSLALITISSFFYKAYLPLMISLWLIKIVAELLFLLPVAGFFNKRSELLWFPILQPLHLLYICLAGFFGYLGKYEWKGRQL